MFKVNKLNQFYRNSATQNTVPFLMTHLQTQPRGLLQIPLPSRAFVRVIDLKTCNVSVKLIDRAATPGGTVINAAWWAGDGTAVMALIYLTPHTDRDS